MYNGKSLVVMLNSAAFSYIRISYVSSTIDVARTVFTNLSLLDLPIKRLLNLVRTMRVTHIIHSLSFYYKVVESTINITHQTKWYSNVVDAQTGVDPSDTFLLILNTN